ncbi:hypothetical protein SLEP1_g10291 [Rubroshorea leprosula]|nr:hypothetical protein SLEP1_g10291 [Rubroshorea leprosula]
MAASTLNSKCGHLPFLYLGLPVGGNPHHLKFWKPVVEKFQSKLATWKGKLLSFGGRITLLTSVLSALPLFYFSIFKVPKGVVSELEKIQKNFLWGSSNDYNKIAWVNWGRVCLAKSKGGLGIPNLSIRNSALLGKWWNNFYDAEGNEKLWKKIIVRKYYDGVSSTSISNTASSSLSPFWKDILSIGRDCDRAFGCFDDGFIRKLGDGSNTRFWKDAWMGSSPLMFSFPRLFCLTLSKDTLVAELKLGNADGWAFQWRRPPFGRELDELERLEDSLRNLNLSDRRLDKFIWKHCSTGYSSKQAYKFLDDFPSCLDKKCCKCVDFPKTSGLDYAAGGELLFLPLVTPPSSFCNFVHLSLA